VPAVYLTIDQLLLPPPGPAFIAVILAAGVADLSLRLGRRLGLVAPVEALAVGIASIGLLCAGLHALALAGAADLTLLRVCGAAIGLLGIWRLRTSGPPTLRALSARLRDSWPTRGWLDRILLAGSTCTLLGLSMAALAPATDADSMDYHLGVPLDWLRHGGAVARPDWLTAKLVGIGESYSMLGLACGTDAAWATLQAAALVAFVLVVGSLEERARQRVFLFAVLSVSPVLLFLTPSQKPMLLPALATTTVILMANSGISLRIAHHATLATCLAFAAACKHSFLFGALIATGLLVYRSRRASVVLMSAIVAFLVVAGPLYARNIAFFGDPLSPMLERFKPEPSPDVVEHARFLRESGLRLGWSSLIGMIVPLTPEAVSTALGLGIVGLAVFRPVRQRWAVLAATAILVVLIGAVGQVNARFLFEPYLWAVTALLGAAPRHGSALLMGGVAVQAVGTGLAALFLAGSLLPGLWTPEWRDGVMARHASGYLEAQWLERLPPDAVVTTTNRSRALLPRPFFVASAPETGFKPGPAGLEAALRDHRVTALVLPVDQRLWAAGYATYLQSICAERDGPPQAFPASTRNPFNRRTGQTVQLYVAGVCPTD
jgi:hypothetical protein